MASDTLVLPVPHKKQAEFISDDHRFQVLNWGRRCFAADTPIQMSDGSQKMIQDVEVGDFVLSYNTELGVVEPKEVLKNLYFGVDKDPKAMIQLGVNGKQTTSTYDHAYYINGYFVPAYQLAWGVLAPSERQELLLLCEQYGATSDNPLQGWLQNSDYEASPRRFWVFKDCNGRQDDKGTSSRSRDMAEQSASESTGQPHQQRSDGQSDRELRVGDTSRESSAHDESGTANSESRGEVWHSCSEGIGCHCHSQAEGATCKCIKPCLVDPTICRLSSSETRYHQGHLEGQDLEISSAKVLPTAGTYDLEVADNHNYIANGLLVSNTGKSVAVWEKVVLQAMLRQGTYYIVGPTYKQVKEIYWQEICKRYRGPFMTFNEQELSITFDFIGGFTVPTTSGDITVHHNPDLPPSRIILKGADNPDSLRGVSLCGAVLDEYAFMPKGKELYETIIRPALADRNGWCTFISTPNGVVNHFYDLVKTAQERPDRYFFSHATALDNPHFSDKEFEEARYDYEKEGKLDQFNQEWMAEFVNPSQLIYDNFSYETHVFKSMDDIPREGTYNMCIDFGMTDPTAALFVKIDYAGNWWVYDEVYKTDLHLDQLVYVLRDKMGDDHFTRIIGDGAARFELESLRKRRFRITGAKKGADSIHNGIRELRALLEVREGTGKPKFFIHAKCTNTIKEFERYSWERDSNGDVISVPEDTFNHAMDALRYLALDKANPTERKRRKREYDPVTGRTLN